MSASEASPGGGETRFGAALNALRHEVLAGRFAQAEMLPGERELSELFGVSRTTLRRVLSVLVQDGVLTHRQGVGTFVKRVPVERPQSPSRLAGFAESMRARGFNPSSRDLSRGVFVPSLDEAAMLGCSPAAKVVRLCRVRYADNHPVAVDRTVIPTSFMPDPASVGGSVYEALEQRGFRPVRAVVRVEARLVAPEDAFCLNATAGSPVLLVRRTAYLTDERCCEFTQSIYRADRYDEAVEVRCRETTVAADRDDAPGFSSS